MKVGIILWAQAPTAGGGYTLQEDVVLSLLAVSAESRHSFVVFCSPEYAGVISHLAVQNSSVEIVPFRKLSWLELSVTKLQREFSLFRKLRKIWRRPSRLERVTRHAGVEFIWFVSYAPVFIDIPYIATVWDLQHRLQPWFPELSVNGEWDSREDSFSWFLRRASMVICGTEVGVREIETFYQVPRQRIKVLPHPTPSFALSAAPSTGSEVAQKYGLPERYLLYPAQFWSHKNHVNLLLALRILHDDYGFPLALVLVGSDKGNLDYVRGQAARLGLSSDVHFLGFVPQSDLIGLYRRAFALSYMTFFGPENLPPLEAFALGCPVIASKVNGAEEQLGEAALLADPKNPMEIAQAVKTLYDDPGFRDRLIQRGYERAAKWTGKEFVRGVISTLDGFESYRRCWGK